MTESEFDFLRRRTNEELDMAERSQVPVAADSHRRLAMLYAKRVAQMRTSPWTEGVKLEVVELEVVELEVVELEVVELEVVEVEVVELDVAELDVDEPPAMPQLSSPPR